MKQAMLMVAPHVGIGRDHASTTIEAWTGAMRLG
jgi:hypothetical protein